MLGEHFREMARISLTEQTALLNHATHSLTFIWLLHVRTEAESQKADSILMNALQSRMQLTHTQSEVHIWNSQKIIREESRRATMLTWYFLIKISLQSIQWKSKTCYQ